MPFASSRLILILVLSILASAGGAAAQRLTTLETQHFRMMYEKKHAALAGEILEIAEKVWPTLAKAYESYEHYERIDILVIDQSDDANGFAIYPWSQVAIFAPHMDWVLRNRQIWLRNVVTHELAHVFSLRRAARLSPFDWVDIAGRTYNARNRINFNFSVPWVPLIAPNWWIEGIAQFEAEQNGNDEYDSQRDMLLRDAWLTGTLPTLDYIETFDPSEDWIQGERVYNTGYAFLRYLKDRFGVDKVRRLAFHKPLFNFSASAEAAFGQSLPDLFEAFKRSLAEKYADFKDLPVDPVADRDMPGTFQQNLVFSSDGRYMAWLGNDESRRFPANWIYWKPVGQGGEVKKSEAPATVPTPPAGDAKQPDPAPEPPAPAPEPQPDGHRARASAWTGVPGASMFRSPNPTLDIGRRYLPLMRPGSPRDAAAPSRFVARNHREVDRSEELGSEGLEFNRRNDRLLTTRRDHEYSTYTDLWEYEFKSRKGEGDKWKRLTWEERASYPSYHPTADKIVFVRKKAGSTNLAVLDSAGRIGQLTNFSAGQQVFNPRYTPKGDSIYFTLQVEDKEAIAAISADAPHFDPFLALKDTAAAFPDSANMARGERITLVTPLRPGGIRHLRFAGDTLFWSSNMRDSGASVYDVYARLPGDSGIYRATRARTQALEPLAHDGDLYYQGFQRQKFLIFKRPLVLAPTGQTMAPTVDTVVLQKPKKIDYTKTFETGEYGSARIAHDIIPFFSLQPQFIENDRTYTDMALGLAVNIGDPLGNWSQGFTAAVAKRLDWRNPINYQFSYAGYLSYASIRHTRQTWSPTLSYSLYHDIIQQEEEIRQSDGFLQGPDSIAVRARTSISTLAKRDYINLWFPLPYYFGIDGAFFRQRISQDLTQKVRFDNTTTGEVFNQDTPPTNILNDALQHQNIQTGLNWGYTWMKVGTHLPTGAALWGSGRKWWANYQTGFSLTDSLLIQTLGQSGRPAPQFVFLSSRFDPWSLDAGAAGIYSVGKHFSFLLNAQSGLFLNKFPVENLPANVNASGDTTYREETVGTLWAMTYQLGYSMMPGYPYNFRYRGRDIMEGTFFGRVQTGFDIPFRGLGFFIPGLPVSSFRQFNITGLANAGTTLIDPADRVYDVLYNQEHDLLVDVGLRLSANFRIYHQFPFTLYVQGFQPINNLRADRLMSEDYPRSAPRPGEGAGAHDARDRNEYMKLVTEPRFFVGFTLGY